MRAGWTVQALQEVADQRLGKMLDKAKNRGTAKPYLRNLNVRWFDFDLSDILEMRFEDEEREQYIAKKGDVLVCEGGYPGRAAIWPHDEPVYFQKALHRVRFHEPERAKWFVYYLYFCDMNGSLRTHFTGAGIQHFTGEALRKFRIPFPALSEQRRIVAILDEAFMPASMDDTKSGQIEPHWKSLEPRKGTGVLVSPLTYLMQELLVLSMVLWTVGPKKTAISIRRRPT